MSKSNSEYDLLVVGGGINGAGIAADAAGRGLKVVLCEKGDLASATSSSSSKLIHGGLRYLEQYEFLLVRKALKERELLAEIRISTDDVGHIKKGQRVTLKFRTYNYAKFGGLVESLDEMSPMTLLDQKGNPYYKGIIKLSKNHLSSLAAT